MAVEFIQIPNVIQYRNRKYLPSMWQKSFKKVLHFLFGSTNAEVFCA